MRMMLLTVILLIGVEWTQGNPILSKSIPTIHHTDFLQSLTNPNHMKRNLIFTSEFLLIDVPTSSNQTTDMVLKKESMFATYGQIFLDFEKVDINLAPLFLGSLVDDKDAIVSLSFPYIDNGDPTPLGMVHKTMGSYTFAKSSTEKRLVENDGLLLVELSPTTKPPEDLDHKNMGCTVTRGENALLDSIEKSISNVKRSPQDGSNGVTWNGNYYEVEVAVETDGLTYTAFSTVDLLSNYINVVYGVVLGIYKRDFYATVKIVHLGIHSPSTNPPTDAASMSVHMSTNHPTVVHDVGVVIQGTFGGGWSQGTGSVCSSSKYSQVGFCFKYGQPTEYNAIHDPYITAHEIGHQLGSIHTHEFNPQIDNCGNGGAVPVDGGVLMSYCVTISDSPFYQSPCWSYCNINAMIMGKVGAYGYQSERVNQVIRAVIEKVTCLSVTSGDGGSTPPPSNPPPPPPPPSNPPPPPPPPSTPPPPPPPPSTPPPPPPPSGTPWSTCKANYWTGKTNIVTPCTGNPWVATDGTWYCPTSHSSTMSSPVILSATCISSSFSAISEQPAEKQQSGLSVGAWVGIGVGAAAMIVLLVVVVVFALRYKKTEEKY